MGKIIPLMIMAAGLNALYYMSGLITDSTSPLIAFLLNPSTVIIGTGVVAAVGIVATLGSAIASLFTSTASSITLGSVFSNLRYAYVIPFILFIGQLIGDGIIIFNRIAQENAALAVLFVSPLFIVATLSIYALWDSGLAV